MIRVAWALLLLMLLGGCASQTLSIRTVPDDQPAEESAAAAAAAAAFAEAAASANAEQASEKQVSAADALPLIMPADAPPMYTYDPWERLNRFTYRFNSRFDEAVFLPAADLYRRFPSPLRAGVHNFFGNLGEIDSIINYTLQWRLKHGLRSVERLAINSTLGVGGLFDVATKLKLPGAATGFGATLSAWGMQPGPYFVMPLLGPSTFRDGIGFGVDYGTMYAIDIAHLYRGPASYPLGTLNAVDQRANVSFRYHSTGSPFEYETIRFLYMRKRLLEDEGLRKRHRRAAPDAPAGK
jgi:phospholipid-binding lipoprotein MlaA